MQRFGEQIEDTRCGPEAEWEEHIYVLLPIPLKNEQPVIAWVDRDVTEGGFEISLHHDRPPFPPGQLVGLRH